MSWRHFQACLSTAGLPDGIILCQNTFSFFDLTIISATPAEHQEIITMMDGRCMNVGLRVRSDKCYSLLFDGKDAKKYPIIKIGGRTSSNIKEKPTTFLGSIVPCSSLSRKKRSYQKFSINSFLVYNGLIRLQ